MSREIGVTAGAARHGTLRPPGERDRQTAASALPGQQQQMSVAGAFSIQPLRVEHVSATTGEVQGTEILPMTAIAPARPWNASITVAIPLIR